MRGEALKGYLHLAILASLRQGESHGYGLIKRLSAWSDGAIVIAEGTIYPALHRLESLGLIEGSWNVDVGTTHRRQRIYVITPIGLVELERRAAAWQKTTRAIDAILEESMLEDPLTAA